MQFDSKYTGGQIEAILDGIQKEGVVKPEDKNILERIELGFITLNEGVNDAVPIQKAEILNSKKNGEFFIVGAIINGNNAYLYSYNDENRIKCFRHYGQDVAIGGFVVMEISNINIEDGTARIDFKAETYPLQQSVLTKTNTTPFTPTEDYHPATKKYVDDLTGGDMVVMTAVDTAGPPTEYAKVVEIYFQQGDLELFNKLISNKKYSHVIVNGATCFGELNGKLLVLMEDNISSILHKEIDLYSGDKYLIWGSWSKPVIPLVKQG